MRGKVNRRDDTVSIYAQELTLPDVSEGPRGPVVVTMETARATAAAGRGAQGRAHQPPRAPPRCTCGWSSPAGRCEIRLDPAYRVNATEALFGDLKVLLGPRCLAG